MQPKELPMSEEELRLAELVRAALGDRADKPFQPFALYHKELDQIWVQIRDASALHVWVNGVLTLIEDNYPEEGEDKDIGFTLDPVQRLCRHYGLSTEQVEIRQLLDAFVKEFPEHSVQVDTARKILEQVESTTVVIAR